MNGNKPFVIVPKMPGTKPVRPQPPMKKTQLEQELQQEQEKKLPQVEPLFEEKPEEPKPQPQVKTGYSQEDVRNGFKMSVILGEPLSRKGRKFR